MFPEEFEMTNNDEMLPFFTHKIRFLIEFVFMYCEALLVCCHSTVRQIVDREDD